MQFMLRAQALARGRDLREAKLQQSTAKGPRKLTLVQAPSVVTRHPPRTSSSHPLLIPLHRLQLRRRNSFRVAQARGYGACTFRSFEAAEKVAARTGFTLLLTYFAASAS